MKRLTVEHILQMHDLLIRETGGSLGLRDQNLLESAVLSPFQTFGGQYVYHSIEYKAARLGFSLVQNHPFVDGNKRVGLLAMIIFLEMNGVYLSYTDEELVRLGLALADGSMDDKALLLWIMEHIE